MVEMHLCWSASLVTQRTEYRTNRQWANSIQRSKVLVTCPLVRMQGTSHEVEAHSPAEQVSHELALRFARKVRRYSVGAVQMSRLMIL